MPMVDAHQHYWKVDAQEQPWREVHHDAIARDFEPVHLKPLLAEAGIAGTVVMQSVDESAENDRLAAYAEDATVAGVVSWLPINDPDAARKELNRLSIPKHVGVRCLIADDPLDWLGDPAVIELFRELTARGLVWDVVPITPEQVENILALADRAPGLRIVIDHLGRPPIGEGGWEPWATNIARLAIRPSIAMKVSIGINVLSSWPQWDSEAVTPYVRHALNHFGAERLMLGTNWPVVLLRASYAQAWGDLSAVVDELIDDEVLSRAVRGGTAMSIYELGRAWSPPTTP